jgi:hypothetical protein
MYAGRHRRTTVRAPRRRRVWADLLDNSRVAPNGAGIQTFDLLSSYMAIPGASSVGVTVARTLIHVSYAPANSAQTYALGDLGHVGLIKAESLVAAADVTPSTKPQIDWAYNEQFHLVQPIRTHTPVVGAAGTVFNLQLDVRAKRRIDEVGESWWFVFQFTANSPAGGTQMHFHARTLILLP